MFHYITWPDFGIPQNSFELINLIKKVNSCNFSRIVVHCSAGVGRTGTYIALSRLMEQIDTLAEHLDVFGTVLSLRSDRKMMVSF